MTHQELETIVSNFIIGDKIKSARERKKYSLDDLSGKSGVSRSYISDIERGTAGSLGLTKLTAIANALGIAITDLFTAEAEHNEFKKVAKEFRFPFQPALGIDPEKAVGLFRDNTGDHEGVFIKTMRDVLTVNDVSYDNVINAVIKVRQKHTKSFFKDREEEADAFRIKDLPTWPDSKEIGKLEVAVLQEYLENKHGYEVNFDAFESEGIDKVTWLFVSGNKPFFFLPKMLSEGRKAFLLAREIYFAKNGLTERRSYDGESALSYSEAWDFYNASYFAGAILLPKDPFAKGLKAVFESDEFDEKRFLECGKSTSPTTFFIRIGEVVPEILGLREYDYVRIDLYPEDTRGFRITNSLNLTKLEDVRKVYSHYHNCRRWGVVEALSSMKREKDLGSRTIVRQAVYQPDFILPTEEQQIFVLAMASWLPLRQKYRGVSIAFKLDPSFKEKVGFWDKYPAPVDDITGDIKIEGRVCELCPIKNCNERAIYEGAYRFGEPVQPWVYNEKDSWTSKKSKIELFAQKVEKEW